MSLMAWIDYGLILVFFALTVGLLVVSAEPHQKDMAVSPALPPVRQNKMTYALLAVLCLFLLYIALLSSKRADSR